MNPYENKVCGPIRYSTDEKILNIVLQQGSDESTIFQLCSSFECKYTYSFIL